MRRWQVRKYVIPKTSRPKGSRCGQEHRAHSYEMPRSASSPHLFLFIPGLMVPQFYYAYFSVEIGRLNILKKINSSSNAHLLSDNSHHLLSSSSLLGIYTHLHPLSDLWRGCHSPRFTDKETEAQRGDVSWSRSKEPRQPCPICPLTCLKPQSPAPCSVHQRGLPSALLGGR